MSVQRFFDLFRAPSAATTSTQSEAVPVPSAVASILCSSYWTWDPDRKCTVQFNEDGTGELTCGVEFNVFIASQFDWKLYSVAGDVATEPPLRLEVAVTLTKRELKDNPAPITHTALKDAAYKQKTYHLELKKGSFRVQDRTTYGHNPTYQYLLSWDKSPYPPLSEWNGKNAALGGQYWERKDFYKGEIEG